MIWPLAPEWVTHNHFDEIASFVGPCTTPVLGSPIADDAILVCVLRLEEVLDKF